MILPIDAKGPSDRPAAISCNFLMGEPLADHRDFATAATARLNLSLLPTRLNSPPKRKVVIFLSKPGNFYFRLTDKNDRLGQVHPGPVVDISGYQFEKIQWPATMKKE